MFQSDTDRDKTPQARPKVSLMEDKKNNLLLSNRLTDGCIMIKVRHQVSLKVV